LLSRLAIALLLSALAIAACKVTKPYRRAENIAGNGLYRDTTITDTTTHRQYTLAAVLRRYPAAKPHPEEGIATTWTSASP
jgi:hypothetical protein